MVTEPDYDAWARESAVALYLEDTTRTAAEVARLVGRQQQTVWNWLKRAGVLRPPRKQQIAGEAVRMYMDGNTYQEVADHFQVDRAMISSIVSARGLNGQGGREVRKNSGRIKARAMYSEGQTYAEIARALKLSPATVARWTEDIEGGNAIAMAKDRQRALDAYGNGSTIEAIASTLGRSVNTVSAWLHEAGVQVIRGIDRQTPEQRKIYSAKGVAARQKPPTKLICAYSACGEEFELPKGRRKSRQTFCSREHAYAARREESGKTTTYICQYPKCEHPEFTWWTNQPRKYCSRDHFLRTSKRIPEYGFEGHQLKSGYEAAFVGFCSVFGVQFEHFDRSGCVEWQPGNIYGPDFKVNFKGDLIYVDTKGQELGAHKWGAFREKNGMLAIVRRNDLLTLMGAETKTVFLSYLRELAVKQQAESSCPSDAEGD